MSSTWSTTNRDDYSPRNTMWNSSGERLLNPSLAFPHVPYGAPEFHHEKRHYYDGMPPAIVDPMSGSVLSSHKPVSHVTVSPRENASVHSAWYENGRLNEKLDSTTHEVKFLLQRFQKLEEENAQLRSENLALKNSQSLTSSLEQHNRDLQDRIKRLEARMEDKLPVYVPTPETRFVRNSAYDRPVFEDLSSEYAAPTVRSGAMALPYARR